MRFALLNGEKTLASPRLNAKCPLCFEEVIAKCGRIKEWHWAHKSSADCDSFAEPETEWHLKWKKEFPKAWQEVTIRKNNEAHRADVLTSLGKVIEFQNSPLSVEKISERERFYGSMVWVLNRETIGKGLSLEDLGIYSIFSRQVLRWYHLPKSWLKAKKPIYIASIEPSYIKDATPKFIFKVERIKRISWPEYSDYTQDMYYKSGWFAEGKLLLLDQFIREVVLVEVPKDEQDKS